MHLQTVLALVGGIAGALFLFVVLFNMLSWRVVVPTDKVHIVQSGKKTISYGANIAPTPNADGTIPPVVPTAGNAYYRVPAWVPVFGVTTKELPTKVFDLKIDGYKAFDKDKVPFDLDVVAFFRIADTNKAAARVESMDDLLSQLRQVVQGAVRKILASHDIHTIMTDRATFGDQFTSEVKAELGQWGVEPVKNLELMDIRDEPGGNVITAIMAVTQSQIEADSRQAVAKNEQAAKSAEIASKQAIEMAEQASQQQVGERTAQQKQAVGIAEELAEQAIQDQLAVTKTKEMAVLAIDTQRKAEIARDAAVVKAQQDQQTRVIEAEAAKTTAITQATAAKETATLQADATKAKAEADAAATKVKGEAEGAAKLALEMAPVNAQLALAKEIGSNQGYQAYLVELRKVEADQIVGVAQAEALKSADLKIIANGGDVASGITGLGDVLTSKGGTGLAGFLAAISATSEGKALLTKLTGSSDLPASVS